MGVRGHRITTLRSREYRALISALKTARTKAGLRQAELAERIGRYETFVTKYEKGERRLDVVEFIWIAKALGIDPRKLLAAAL